MTAANPLVSVVIPFFNAERTLLPTVRSVLAQSYVNWELILLDDGSTDGSLALARSIADPRVQVVSDGHNRGLINRLNQMLELSRGELIARMDADDLMHPQRLEKQVAAMLADPSLDVLATGIAVLDGDYWVTGVRDTGPLDMRPASVLTIGSIVHPSVMLRRAWLQTHPYRGGYHRAEDRELWLRALPDTHFGKLKEPLLFYREFGVQSPHKLLGSYRTERRILREYGPRYVGRAITWWLCLRSLAKSAAIGLLQLAGRLDWLVKRRMVVPDEDTRRDLQRVVDAILATPAASSLSEVRE